VVASAAVGVRAYESSQHLIKQKHCESMCVCVCVCARLFVGGTRENTSQTEELRRRRSFIFDVLLLGTHLCNINYKYTLTRAFIYFFYNYISKSIWRWRLYKTSSRQPFAGRDTCISLFWKNGRRVGTYVYYNIIVVILAWVAVLGPPLQGTIVTCTLSYQRRTHRE